ncbi:MAG: WG repeat-containing protein [Candidatus Limiplasma sp.]|nr:WG repeat-containing protein [Candidatus Limiplasma sp.]MEA5145337.1 WG repeat-containing protein [Candidatus Limiplasma sp.]
MKTRILACLCLLLLLPALAVGEAYLVDDAAATAAPVAPASLPDPAAYAGNAEMQAALALLEEGSYLAALNAFAGVGGVPEATQYAEYAHARLLLLRDDPAAAAEKLTELSGFLDSDAQLALCRALRLHRCNQNAKFGYVDAQGTWLVPPQFDWAERVLRAESAVPGAADPLPVALVFGGQTNITATDIEPLAGKYGLIRSDGMLVVPVRYDSILWARHGFAAASDAAGVTLYNLTTGETLGELYEAVGAYAEGFIPVQKGGLWGYLNPASGQMLGDGLVWDSALPFSEGKAAVGKDKLYGYIDAAASTVIPLQYTDAAPFSEGLAGVRIKKKWGFIDQHGTVIIKPAYAQVKTFQYGLCAVKRGDAWGLLNTAGEIVLRAKYSEITDFDPIQRRAWVRQNKLWGMASTSGTMVLAPTWSSHDFFQGNTLCRVGYRGRYGYIDANGKMRILIEYSAAAPFTADYGAVQEDDGTVRYLNKTQRSFTVDTDVPVECRMGFIEARRMRKSIWNTADAEGNFVTTETWNISFALYDKLGQPIAVQPYADAQASGSGI